MGNFLGVPIMIRNEAFGNLYLTDKTDGDFDEADEQAAVILAAWAAIAVENSRLYREMSSRRDALERANRGLEAITTVARAVGAETDLDRLLDLIVKRARALVNARTVVIWLQEGDELAVVAIAGEPPQHGKDARMPVTGSMSGEVARSGRAERLSDAGASLRLSLDRLGLEASSALLAPLSFRGEVSGVIAAYDHLGADRAFSASDEELLQSFAASAATAVATAQSVASERLRQTCTPPSGSASAGRASSTTRRSKGSPALRSPYGPRAAPATPRCSRRPSTAWSCRFRTRSTTFAR